MLIIGLTGSIGSGKSSAAHCFEKLGVPIIDADNVAKALCDETEIFQKIHERFGDAILNEQGALNRKKLRDIIFQNKTEKIWLENLLHPLIIETIVKWSQTIHAPYCIVVAPLLLETSLKNHVDRILVIDCPEDLLVKRVSMRDQVENEQVIAILEHQLSRRERLAAANDVIVNDGSLEDLEAKVAHFHSFYLKIVG